MAKLNIFNREFYFGKPREKKEKPKQSLIPFSNVETYGNWGSDLDKTAQLEAYRGWVYAAVSKISDDVSAVPVTLNKMTEKNGEVVIEQVRKHDVLDLLDRVNPFLTYNELVSTTFIPWLLCGESYWWLIKSGGKIVEIYPWLRADRVSPIKSATEFIAGWKYAVPGRGDFQQFDVDEIIQFKYPNPLDPYSGVSPLKAAELAVATDRKAAEYNWRFFGNQARPDFILQFDGTLNETQVKQIRSQWENMHGEGKEHKVGIMSNGKIQELGRSHKDMDFIRQREYSRDEILALYKVPKALLDPQDLNFASAKIAIEVFQKQVVIPNMRRFVNTLNEFLLPHFDSGDNLFFDFESPLEGDPEQQRKDMETMSKVGAITPNEIREENGRPPFDGGDDVYLPMNMTPVGGLESAKVGTIDRSKKREKKHNVRIRSRSKTAEMIEDIKKKLKDDKIFAKKKKVQEPIEEKEAWEIKAEADWRNKIKRTDKDEEAMKKLLIPEFERQRKQVIKSMREKSVGFAFGVEGEATIFTEIFYPFLLELVEEYGEGALAKLGLGGFDASGEVSKNLMTTTGKFAKDVNTTTELHIKKAIKDGLDNGEGLNQIKNRVSGVFDNATTARANMITRTEVAKSSNYATIQAWKQSGVVTEKRWFTALDERVCPTCDSMHGTTVSLTKDFHPDYSRVNADGDVVEIPADQTFGAIQEPPAHQACRCDMIPMTKSKSQHLRDMKKQEEAMAKELIKIKAKGEEVVKDIQGKGETTVAEIKETKDKLNKIIEDNG